MAEVHTDCSQAGIVKCKWQDSEEAVGLDYIFDTSMIDFENARLPVLVSSPASFYSGPDGSDTSTPSSVVFDTTLVRSPNSMPFTLLSEDEADIVYSVCFE